MQQQQQQQEHRLLINVAFLKPAILCSKPPLALRSLLHLVLSRTRFFFFFFFNQRSSFALLTTMSLEMRQWQSFLYHALATGQCPVFRNNNLRTPGSFGSFSRCSDEVSK